MLWLSQPKFAYLQEYDGSEREACLQDGGKHETVEETGTNDRSLLQVSKRKELNRSEEFLPDDECSEADDSNDNHYDDVCASPFILGRGSETEWEEDE